MEILALIPARGGSKALPGKNVRNILGHPLISYSILAARSTRLINRVIVSTDSEHIAGISLKYGAEIPFMRPAEYAQDLSTDFEVFYYTLKRLLDEEKYRPDYVVQFRPTTPVRFLSDIENCITSIIADQEADSLRVVTPPYENPYKMWHLDEQQKYLSPLLTLSYTKEPYNEPRQNLPVVYWQTGTIDIIKTSVILEKKSMTGQKILPYIIDPMFAADIDTLEDFNRAAELIEKHDCIKHGS